MIEFCQGGAGDIELLHGSEDVLRVDFGPEISGRPYYRPMLTTQTSSTNYSPANVPVYTYFQNLVIQAAHYLYLKRSR